VAQRVERWIEVTPSQFTHEAAGLSIIRALLPSTAPFRAWSNIEFRDASGKWHEVDLVVLGRRRLHLVELKYYSGSLRGDDLTWRRDGHRAEDSPLKLARRKATHRLKWPSMAACRTLFRRATPRPGYRCSAGLACSLTPGTSSRANVRSRSSWSGLTLSPTEGCRGCG